ncbi:MAG: adenylyltransferase/cytidyltransferase family protein [Lentisphaeria bacterium]|nr:adenylyltransferase/cytidyltransferase family protein [Lentisphaeria bacterium]
MSLADALEWRETLRRQRIRLAVTNGCFDLLHRGHVEYLDSARRAADALLVLVNSDNSVRALKGPSRPLNDEYSRAFVLAGLAAVDAAVVFDSERCTAELAALAPDVYVKGGDYTVETLDPGERQALQENNTEIFFIPFVQGFSTTGTINKMR